ncbi:MAG: PKD domain-containing protein [Methanobacteriota archaeon]
MKILTGLIATSLLLLLCVPTLAVEFEPLANFSIEEVMTQIPGLEEQLTFDSVYDWKPRVDERYVTWVVYNGEGKVWYYDTQGGTREMVANVPGDQNDPDISGGVIVWDDNRNGNSDIYSYNIAMNKEDIVYSSTSNKFRPAISNDVVAFEDYGTDDIRDIGFKKVGSTANPVFIDPNSMDKANPDIDGDWIVYQQLDDGREDWDIYAYNIKTQQLIQVTRDPATQQNPRISGDLITWEDNRNGKWDIFMYNIKKDLTTAVTFDDVDDRSPSISGSNIVWTRFEQDGTSDIYMINLQIPKTYVVCAGPGNQINPDIYVDKVVWQDDRFGNWDIFLYTLKPDTPFRPYEFYGPVTLNYVPAPIGTVLIAKVDGRTKDTITVTQDGYYGGQGSYADKLSVDVNQADIGRYITFWTEGFQGAPSIPISGDGATTELPLNFVYAQPLPDLYFYGSVSIDGQPAPQGTKLIAKIDDVVRGEYTTTQTGQYGGAGEQDPAMKIPLTELDLGKHVTFWQGDYKAIETFQITSGGKFSQDLSFTQATPLSPYEFYGYVQLDGMTAPAGTLIQARIDGVPITTYSTRYAGSYGGPGDNPEDTRLIVPVKEADVGKTISFWSGTQTASVTQVIARSGEHIIRKDLDFSASTGINADFVGYPTSGNAPLTVKFTDLSTGSPTMWVWDFGDGPIPMNVSSCSGDDCNSIANPVHTYTQPGTYTVTLTASNQNSSDSEVKQAYIVVGGSPGFMADFTASPTTGQAPLTVKFTDLTIGGPTMWAWDFGDGTTDMVGSPTHTYTKDGTYTVTLRASNQYGDSDTEIKQSYIVVGSSSAFMADFTASPTSGSAPLTVKFTDKTVGGPTMWAWDFGDGVIPMGTCSGDNCNNIANPTHTYTKYGAYTVTLTASNQYGNSDTESKVNYINVLDVPPSPDSISISAGWNFVSVPKKLAPGKDTAAIFGNIDVDGHSIFQYDSIRGQWVTLTQTSQVKPLDAVWIYSKNVGTVPLTFDTDPLQIPPTRELKRGWNAIGFTGFESLEAKFTLLSVQDKWINCLGFNRELQKYNEMIIKGRNDDTKMNPYNGYWLFMSDDGVLAAISA